MHSNLRLERELELHRRVSFVALRVGSTTCLGNKLGLSSTTKDIKRIGFHTRSLRRSSSRARWFSFLIYFFPCIIFDLLFFSSYFYHVAVLWTLLSVWREREPCFAVSLNLLGCINIIPVFHRSFFLYPLIRVHIYVCFPFSFSFSFLAHSILPLFFLGRFISHTVLFFYLHPFYELLLSSLEQHRARKRVGEIV